jgi:hypothetical protein
MKKYIIIFSILILLTLVNVVFATEIGVTRIQKFEMVDSDTGNVYCTWMKNGQWQQVNGYCDSDAVQNMVGQAPGWSGQQGQQFSGSAPSTSLQSQIDALNKKITEQQKQITALHSVPTPAPETTPEPAPVSEVAPAPETTPAPEITPTQEVAPVPEQEQVTQPAPVEQQPSAGDTTQSAGASLLNAVGNFFNFIISPIINLFKK